MTRPIARSIAAGCALSLLLPGCYTGAGRAASRRELLQPGMSELDVRELLGEPDQVRKVPDGSASGGTVEWTYCYNTPVTMFLAPMLGLFTIIFSVPSFYCLMGMGMGGSGRLTVEFGHDGTVLRALTEASY